MEVCTCRENRVMSTHAPSACPVTLMALLEPSCPPRKVWTSRQCGNSLLKHKDSASLGVIKPVKKNRLLYALLNHMIEILWSAVSQSTWEALTISVRDVSKLFMLATVLVLAGIVYFLHHS